MSTIRMIWSEHVEWRNQILKLARADIIKTYSGAALGWARVKAINSGDISALEIFTAGSDASEAGGEQ